MVKLPFDPKAKDADIKKAIEKASSLISSFKPIKNLKGTDMGLAAIDIFPHQLTTRINYNGREDVKTHMGGFCTIFYVFCLIAITVYFAVPIVRGDNPYKKEFEYTSPDDYSITVNEEQLIWFEIHYWWEHYDLGNIRLGFELTLRIDRTMIDIYINLT